MTINPIDNEMSLFAHKNVSLAPNAVYSVATILLVLFAAAQNGHSLSATAQSPDSDSVFYRLDTSIRQMQDLFWKQNLSFLRRKKKKLAKLKCYITIDETHDSYTGNLHKKPIAKLTSYQKTVRKYIHSYKPKKGDRGSFKYLVFALVYGNKKRVLRVKAIRKKEEYWSFVVKTLIELYREVKFECALLDRGFYVGKLVDDLQKENIPFIIRARLCDEMKKIFGIYRKWKAYDYAIAEWAWTKLILGRDLWGRKWGFITNLDLDNLENSRRIYKKRWNIENIFKATDGIQLRVATSNHITRMFCVCFSFIVYNAWQQRNKRPTLLDYFKQVFKNLLQFILRIVPYRDRLRLNLPLWDFIKID